VFLVGGILGIPGDLIHLLGRLVAVFLREVQWLIRRRDVLHIGGSHSCCQRGRLEVPVNDGLAKTSVGILTSKP